MRISVDSRKDVWGVSCIKKSGQIFSVSPASEPLCTGAGLKGQNWPLEEFSRSHKVIAAHA